MHHKFISRPNTNCGASLVVHTSDLIAVASVKEGHYRDPSDLCNAQNFGTKLATGGSDETHKGREWRMRC